MNLFSNAMKYTTSGFVKVSLQVEENGFSRDRKARPTLILKVKDSGKGISKEFLRHRLYKPFTQEDSLAAGAGLGLSIVRHIIQDLGGQIGFSSEQGSGTEAIVHIPLKATNAAAKLASPTRLGWHVPVYCGCDVRFPANQMGRYAVFVVFLGDFPAFWSLESSPLSPSVFTKLVLSNRCCLIAYSRAELRLYR